MLGLGFRFGLIRSSVRGCRFSVYGLGVGFNAVAELLFWFGGCLGLANLDVKQTLETRPDKS